MGIFVGVTNLKFKLLHLISIWLSVFNGIQRYRYSMIFIGIQRAVSIILNQHFILHIDDIRKHIFNKLTL